MDMSNFIHPKDMDASKVQATLDRMFTGRKFEVYSIVTGASLSEAKSFNEAFDEMDRMMMAGNGGSGIDLREVL